MTTRIIGVNGIASNGVDSTDVLLTALAKRGYETVDFNYPKISLLKAAQVMSFWLYDKTVDKLAKQLFEQTQDGDHVVAHSFGCAIVWQCIKEYGRNFGKVWLIAPAISIDAGMVPIFTGTEQITFVHNPYDRALKFGRMAPWIDLSDIGLNGFRRKHQVYEPPYRNVAMPFRYLRGETKDWLNHSYAFGRVNLPVIIDDVMSQLSV